jgi:succinyl-CoA synthetase beta subunit
MIGHKLYTVQTGKEGLECKKVMIAELITHKEEFYYSILLTNNTDLNPIIIFSSKGGVNIESLKPDELIKVSLDIENDTEIKNLAKKMNNHLNIEVEKVISFVKSTINVFKKCYATLIEINPGIVKDGRIMCLDAKISIDENALSRIPDFKVQEENFLEPINNLGMSYVKLDGDIACLVNGAGLSMATLDLIKLKGGSPANFLDIGGAARRDMISKAIQLIMKQENVKVIFINAFGGIIKCDDISKSILDIKTDLVKPIVVRLLGKK